MKKPNIILTGFMGTGKTTIGKRLAKQLDYDFLDTDDMIVERAGRSIPEIFAELGETAFREMEAAVVRDITQMQGQVVATGGRLMLDPDNAAALTKTGRVFCLIATPEEILDRVTTDTGHERPLLAVDNPMARIVELMDQRKDGYGQFPPMVTSQKTPDEISKTLIGFFQADPDLRVPITAPGIRYEYIVGGGLLPFVTYLAGIVGPVAIITDTNTGPLYAQSCGSVGAVITIPPGQQQKTLATVEKICIELVEKGFDRGGTIIGLGGSVISGIAGFVASVYMRGVDLVHCPTSLLSMIDTSIGGKAGINLPQGKNLLGTFKQPKVVIADVATLQSLSPEEFSHGMAEVIKHALIGGGTLCENIEQGCWRWDAASGQPSLAVLQDLVAQAIRVKVQIVQEDPFEKGRRAVLNLGHTFAHAIEQVSRHAIYHGEAVAMGLVAAANLSSRLGHCQPGLQERIEAMLESVSLPIRIPEAVDPHRLLDAMNTDKKKRAGRIRFVLMRDIGDAFVTDAVDPSTVIETILDLKA